MNIFFCFIVLLSAVFFLFPTDGLLHPGNVKTTARPTNRFDPSIIFTKNPPSSNTHGRNTESKSIQKSSISDTYSVGWNDNRNLFATDLVDIVVGYGAISFGMYAAFLVLKLVLLPLIPIIGFIGGIGALKLVFDSVIENLSGSGPTSKNVVVTSGKSTFTSGNSSKNDNTVSRVIIAQHQQKALSPELQSLMDRMSWAQNLVSSQAETTGKMQEKVKMIQSRSRKLGDEVNVRYDSYIRVQNSLRDAITATTTTSTTKRHGFRKF